MESRDASVVWIELWHGVLVLVLLAVLVPLGLLDPWGLFLGGLFMGVNFFLLSCGIRWTLTPLAGRGRVRAGVLLLAVKLLLLLGLVWLLFLGLRLDPLSFAAGISCLLAAIVLQALGSCVFSQGARE